MNNNNIVVIIIRNYYYYIFDKLYLYLISLKLYFKVKVITI